MDRPRRYGAEDPEPRAIRADARPGVDEAGAPDNRSPLPSEGSASRDEPQAARPDSGRDVVETDDASDAHDAFASYSPKLRARMYQDDTAARLLYLGEPSSESDAQEAGVARSPEPRPPRGDTADGLNDDLGLAQDAKYVATDTRSWFVPDSMPPAMRQLAQNVMDKRLIKYREVINDDSNPIRGLEIIVNNRDAAQAIASRMSELQIAGIVRLRS